MLATATPISADCDAAVRPAARTSGRRRSRSFGMPTAASRRARRESRPSPPSTRVDRVGRHAEQHARGRSRPGAACSAASGSAPRSGASSVGRLAHVELARLAVLELDRGDAEALLLRLDVARRDAQPLLGRADVHVARGHVGDDGDEGVVVGRHACRGTPRGPTRCRGGSCPRRRSPRSRAKSRLSSARLTVIGVARPGRS